MLSDLRIYAKIRVGKIRIGFWADEDMVDRRIDSLVVRHCAVAGARVAGRCHGLEAVDGP